MAKFRNQQGKVIETNDPATVLNYRNHPGMTEVKSRAKSSDSESAKSTTSTDKK